MQSPASNIDKGLYKLCVTSEPSVPPTNSHVSLRTGLLEDSLMCKMLGCLLDCLSFSHLVQRQEQGFNIGNILAWPFWSRLDKSCKIKLFLGQNPLNCLKNPHQNLSASEGFVLEIWIWAEFRGLGVRMTNVTIRTKTTRRTPCKSTITESTKYFLGDP